LVNIVLGTKVQEFSFKISDMDLETLQAKDPDYTILKNGDILVSESKTDYIVLSGTFSWTKMLQGDYDAGIKSLDAIAVYENGQLTYKASGLGMTGVEVDSGAVFKAYLAEKGYTIKGNGFANEIVSEEKNDVIRGLSGNDTIDGKAGLDKLFGDQGADRLIGGEGNDILTGGAGADVFAFKLGDGNDVVMDFLAHGKAQDHIDLTDYKGVDSFQDLDVSRAGRSTLITFADSDDSILLKNVSVKFVDEADFLF
jgi:Ca2+-binding RTX toxin-like protein